MSKTCYFIEHLLCFVTHLFPYGRHAFDRKVVGMARLGYEYGMEFPLCPLEGPLKIIIVDIDEGLPPLKCEN